MFNIIQLFCIILITSVVCFLLFQLWFYIENYSYILDFNEIYKKLEFTNTSNINFTDISVYDPNDNVFDVDYKWRCVLYNSKYYPISRYGFMSIDNVSKGKSFDYLKDCIIDMFDTRIPIIYNPCVIETSSDCILLNNLLKQTN
jgi:hypothetical protein